jgi:hypothetical protein
MIWVALLIGATVLLAIASGRRAPADAALGAPRNWLVLPDEPARGGALALLAPAASTLPALAILQPVWTAVPAQSWRTDKPVRPWFRGPAPYAVAMALGAISLDLTAAGLGVPEIFPTHLSAHHQHAAPALADPDHGAGAMFGGFVADAAPSAEAIAWLQPDFIAPSWERPHEHGHDWWA